MVFSMSSQWILLPLRIFFKDVLKCNLPKRKINVFLSVLKRVNTNSTLSRKWVWVQENTLIEKMRLKIKTRPCLFFPSNSNLKMSSELLHYSLHSLHSTELLHYIDYSLATMFTSLRKSSLIIFYHFVCTANLKY